MFALFVEDKIINLLALETNRYTQQKSNPNPCSQSVYVSCINEYQLKTWRNKKILRMGFVKANLNYWSKNPSYNFQLPYAIMS